MDRLKELRLTAGKSQAEIAAKLGITQQAYANYERGARQADYDTLKKLSNIFNTSIDFLLGANEHSISESNFIALSFVTIQKDMGTSNTSHAIRSFAEIIKYKNSHNERSLFKSDITLKYDGNRIIIAVEYRNKLLPHALYCFLEMLSGFQVYSLMEDYTFLSGVVFVGPMSSEPHFTPSLPRILIDSSVIEIINSSDFSGKQYDFSKFIKLDNDKKTFLNYLSHILPWEYVGADTSKNFLDSFLIPNALSAQTNSANTNLYEILNWTKTYYENFYKEHSQEIGYARRVTAYNEFVQFKHLRPAPAKKIAAKGAKGTKGEPKPKPRKTT